MGNAEVIDEIKWLSDALATKEVEIAMTHFHVRDGEIRATDGRIIAGHPINIDGEFLVPGEELQQILKRLPHEPTITIDKQTVKLRSGRFHGSIQTLDLSETWRFHDIGKVTWTPFPTNLWQVLRDLRPFISNNAVHRWAMGVAIIDGWALASNNVSLAGAACDTTATAIIPSWAIDFILQRSGLTEWAVSEHYMMFRWQSGAWMYATLIDDKFPEKAAAMIKQDKHPSQPISADYREAMLRIADLTEDYVEVYADRVVGRTIKSEVQEELTSEIPKDQPCSRWGGKFIEPVMQVAMAWQPSNWPQPAIFVGERVQGVLAARR